MRISFLPRASFPLKRALATTACVALLFSLSACDTNFFKKKGKTPLEGERISVLELQKALEPDSALMDEGAIDLPDAWNNEFWPQSGGYPNHAMQNLAFNADNFDVVWAASIGEGSTDEVPLVAQPIVAGGYIFTLDGESRLSALSVEDGSKLWRASIADPHEDERIIGGGIAFADGVLYATNGSNEAMAIRANDDSADILWRVRLPVPARAAPTIIDGRVYIITMDNRLLALNASTGATIWEYVGLDETSGLIGAASPAATFDIVLPAFSSGEITALRVENGSVGWSDNLGNVRRVGGLTSLSDIRALPVVDKGLVFAISFSGRMVAIDERTGNRVWQREIGGSQTPWIAGDYVFVISSDSEVVALGREDGVIRWVEQLQKYEDPEDKDGKLSWAGPVMAGGRLVVAGSNGDVITADPSTGKIISRRNLDDSFLIAPLVAGKTLYLLGDEGMLYAVR